MIRFDEKTQTFYLHTKLTSYIFSVYRGMALLHLYWGKRLSGTPGTDTLLVRKRRLLSAIDDGLDYEDSLDVLPLEYSVFGGSDLRNPALCIEDSNGTNVIGLRFVSHKIISGKPKLHGLPASYVENPEEAETLEIELRDDISGVSVFLTYSVFEEYNAITRNVRVKNNGEKAVKINNIMSASVDFQGLCDFDFLHLSGAPTREFNPMRRPIQQGDTSIGSRRGASGHFHNPFFALAHRNTDENSGEVYGFSMIYSGSFTAGVEMDPYNTARAYIGINPAGFGWTLEPAEEFQSPEAVLVFSSDGFSGMSRVFHRFYRERLCRGKFRDIERYVLINNWEATYFDFTEEKLIAIAEKAAEIGIDMLVLDDGWFGNRNNDKSSLGDWYVNRSKLPDGLSCLIEKVNSLGLKFGLWFEPEMISRDSDLFRKHPDWHLHIKGRETSLCRYQMILDLSRDDVCDYIIDRVSDILSNNNIAYVKWDMNRNMSEVSSGLLPSERQCEVRHRYILGLYRILETLTSRFPDVLFESCASGGGRFDPGMLYYMPQTWTSDNTDGAERVRIQYGNSFVYPFSAMGAHVSAVPNHQTGRTTPFKTRGDVAMMGQFGFELDLSKLTQEETETAKKMVSEYRELGSVFHRGDLYRLKSPFESDTAAFEFVSEDKNTVVVNIFSLRVIPNAPVERIRLHGLDSNRIYVDADTGRRYCGDELMNAGLLWMNEKEYGSHRIVLRAEEPQK